MKIEKTKITDLRVEHCTRPLGVEASRPGLAWRMECSRRGASQSAYRIVVASHPEKLAEGDYLWDSGIIESDLSAIIPYEGRKLCSRQRCWWQVHVWDDLGQENVSDPAYWEMGLLNHDDWLAQWITAENEPRYRDQPVSPLLRHRFTLAKKPCRARAYVCGLGTYELFLNDKKSGDAVLNPAFTHYDKRSLYVVHDITDMVDAGANAVGIMLGTGWYDNHCKDPWGFCGAIWRDSCKALVQIEVEYSDGERMIIGSDSSWLASTGPILFDGLRYGEIYDAREEKSDWSLAVCDESNWKPVTIARPPGGQLRAQIMPPIRVIERFTPAAIREIRPGVHIVDAGRNVVGWVRLRARGQSGDEVVMRYSEILGKDGDIDRESISWVKDKENFATDTYIMKGEGLEEWECRFAYHGFQYVQLSGLTEKPDLTTLEICVVSTDFPLLGHFESSDEYMNRLHEICIASTRANYHGFPTDCPHREKLGWTADAHLASDQILYNFDVASSYTKWLDDFVDCQRESGAFPAVVPSFGFGFNWGSGPAWDSAYILIAWKLYVYCGDTEILRRHFSGMLKYLRFLKSIAVDHIVTYGLGDWSPPAGSPDDVDKCPAALTNTAYYYSDVVIISRIANLLGEHAEFERLNALAEDIKRSFRAAYLDPETGCPLVPTQTAVACVVYQGLANESELPALREMLVQLVDDHDGHLDTGILGTKYLLNALTEMGRTDVAMKIVGQRTFPGWCHWLEQGATTIWESWGGGGSQNHVMFSDVGAWLHGALAGIRLDDSKPGFKKLIIKPYFAPEMKFAESSIMTPYGSVKSAWKQDEECTELHLTIPPNSSAVLILPYLRGGWRSDESSLEENERFDSVQKNGPEFHIELISGIYQFRYDKRR